MLNYYNRKDKPYLYFDTHGGAGLYNLKSAQAQKNSEFETGYRKLQAATNLPEPLAKFIAYLEELVGNPNLYPGSPYLAASLLRQGDTLRTCERHPTDMPILQSNLAALRKRRTIVESTDGYQTLLGALPPPQHRAVVLIDPSYEEKKDYSLVVKTAHNSLKRFAPITLLIWYPQLQRQDAQALPKELITLAQSTDTDYLLSELTIHAPSADGFGMHGSGMFLFNPPYQLPQTLETLHPAWLKYLQFDDKAHYRLEYQIT